MVNLLAPPSWTPVDGNGKTYPGALAYFFRTGTSTPQDTYADAGLTTPNANPVVADASGRFAPIYLSANFDYKLVLKTAAGATIFTVDPVPLQSFQTTVVLNGSQLSVMPFTQPQGRLTLQSGEPVMRAAYTGKTTLYYTPYAGNLVPIWDGANFVPTTFSELSNILTNSATGKAGPAVAGPYQNIDGFVWNDAGTVRLSRGPKWIVSATVTITIASPGVVTWTGHPFGPAGNGGATVRFTTTGALPTGLTASTDYFVTVVDANTFRLSTSLANQLAGTFINTSGTQSGVHTAENYTTARGTGAGTTELEILNGIPVNKNDIVNGPMARKGTYVSTIYCDSASQANWHTGGVGAGGVEAKLHVWNAYNRVNVAGVIGDTTDSWNYTTATWRAANAASAMRAAFVVGLQEDAASAGYVAYTVNAGGPSNGFVGIGYDSTSTPSGRRLGVLVGGNPLFVLGDHAVQPAIGLHFLQALEYSTAVGTATWYGDNGGTILQTGLTYQWRC